ncbi:MAG: exonuclease domain-containing protein [Clostridia bacterium]
MNYLFFDIECANCFGGHGKICSFGYVIVDEDWNIVDQKDITINPREKFHLQRRDGTDYIKLAYDEEVFANSPDFVYYYPTINALLSRPDQICFGHSVINDIHFLMSECSRFKTPYFAITAFDSQILYKHFAKESLECGLEKICAKFDIEVENLHRSDYDAFLTMQIVHKMCQSNNVGKISELLELCPTAFYSAQDGVVTNHYATVSVSKKLAEFARYTKMCRVSKINIINKIFCLSEELENEHFNKALYLVKLIRQNGGFYTSKLRKCDFYLAYGDDEKLKNAESSQETEKPHKILNESEFFKLLGVDEKTFAEVETYSISRVKKMQ